jgi:hypothetical protein
LFRALEKGDFYFQVGFACGFLLSVGNLNELAALESSLAVGLLPRFRSLLLMTLDALKHRDITKIHRMLEWLVRFMAIVAFVVGERAQINRVLEWSGLHILFGWGRRVVDHRVTDVAVVGDDFAGVADVLTIVTTEAA